jgi:tetratricopeptide (TPR) repeat protein
MAVATGELSPVPERDPEDAAVGADEELARHVTDWEASRTLGHAADLVSAAVVLGRPRAAEAAAEFLVGHRPDAGEIAYRLARLVLEPGNSLAAPAGGRPRQTPPGATATQTVRNTAASAIRDLRRRLRDDPNNPIAWLDLGRQYARLGVNDHAERAIRSAITLARDHRFILRSGSRFFLHNGMPEEAHAILRRSAATPHDPWLLAAEISVATVLGRTSRLIKPGRNILASGRFALSQTTELAGALATVEAADGRRRVAKQLFLEALRDPTDNVVAQAEWAARRLKLIEFPEAALNVPRTFEARTWTSYAAADWELALVAAWAWLDDEPFASRPAELGASVAAVALQDGDQAVRFASLGVLANPNSVQTRNNEVFALVHAGRMDQAIAAHLAIGGARLADVERVVWLANSGMIAYRLGEIDLGEKGYRAATEAARQLNDKTLEAIAKAYWAASALTAVAGGRPGLAGESATPEGESPTVRAETLAQEASDELRSLPQTPDVRLATVAIQKASANLSAR